MKYPDSDKKENIQAIAHDLRQVVSNISGLCKLADNRIINNDVESVRVYINLVDASCIQGLELINGLLSTHSKNNQSEANYSLNEFLKNLSAEYRAKSLQKEIKLRLIICNDNIYLNVDKFKLRRILDNLFDNACKFAPQKGIIELKLIKLGNNARISIKDNGPGIEEEHKLKIFEKHYVGIKSKKDFSSGLGLHIVKTLISEINGNIWFDSDNNGTEFFITLKCC